MSAISAAGRVLRKRRVKLWLMPFIFGGLIAIGLFIPLYLLGVGGGHLGRDEIGGFLLYVFGYGTMLGLTGCLTILVLMGMEKLMSGIRLALKTIWMWLRP